MTRQDAVLSIDFGTSFTAAALSVGDAPPTVVTLGDAQIMPSVVAVGEGGKLLVGEAANSQATVTPDAADEHPKRSLLLGRRRLVLGDAPVPMEDLLAAVFAVPIEMARGVLGGELPGTVVLTHPAIGVEDKQRAVMEAAARKAGVTGEVTFLEEPVAAARHFLARRAADAVDEGGHIAVYDLGGGTFDVAVLRWSGERFEVSGTPTGLQDIGGVEFDAKLRALVLEKIKEVDDEAYEQLDESTHPRWRRARRDLLHEVRRAKERLAWADRALVAMPATIEHGDLADDGIVVSRSEFEDEIRVDLVRSIATLDDALRASPVTAAELGGLYLVGGSSRIPLIREMVREKFGKEADTEGDPKAVIALGAARLAVVKVPPPPPPPPPRQPERRVWRADLGAVGGGSGSASDWALAIDFGSSFTTAAVRRGDERAASVDLGEGRPLASCVLLDETGTLVAGEAARAQSALYPDRAEESPKRALQRGLSHLLLGGRAVGVDEAIAAVLRPAWDEALRRHDRLPPARVALTHPAAWGDRQKGVLLDAAALAGIPGGVELVPEPVAAVLHFGSSAGASAVPLGGHVAVYDLGGGTFDAAVLRRNAEGFEVVGRPLGLGDVGGLDLDDRLFRYAVEALAATDTASAASLVGSQERSWRRARRALGYEVRRAKEQLSTYPSAQLEFPDPIDREPLRVTREELERLVRPSIEQTLETMDATLATAGVGPSELSALYLAGGSARIPLVEKLVNERFERADTEGDPKAVVALGATVAEGLATTAAPPPRPEPPAPPPTAVHVPDEPANGGAMPDGQPPRPTAPEPVAHAGAKPGDAASRWALGLSIVGFLVGVAAIAGLIVGYNARSANDGRDPDIARRAQMAIVVGWIALALSVLWVVLLLASG